MPEKLLEYGLSGIVMGGVMYLVVKPLVLALLEQLDAANVQLNADREERENLCARHQEFHNRTIGILEGLRSAVDAMVRRANGGH
jgi:hypothetical protein